MITVTKSTVPSYLQNGAFYCSLSDNEKEPFFIPADCMKANEIVESAADTIILLKTLSFWGVDCFIDSLYDFTLENDQTECWETIFADFKHLPQVPVLLSLVAAPRAKRAATAIQRGRLDVVLYFQRKGKNFPNDSCNLAVSAGHLGLLRHFHQSGYCCDGQSCKLAVRSGHLECLKYVHEVAGVPLALSSVLLACQSGSADCLRYALQEGCQCSFLASQLACESGHCECLEVLIEYGADISFGCGNCAAKGGHINCLQLLHERGTPIPIRVYYTSISARKLDFFKFAHQLGCCPWDENIAAFCANEDCVEFLRYVLDNNCALNVAYTVEAAARNGALDCLHLLHARGFPFSARTFMIAAFADRVDVLQVLLDLGCSWDASACTAAVQSCLLDNLRFLHEHGCPWDTRTWALGENCSSMEIRTYLREHGCPGPQTD